MVFDQFLNRSLDALANAAGTRIATAVQRADGTIGPDNVIAASRAVVAAMAQERINSIPNLTLLVASSVEDDRGFRAARILADRLRANRIPTIGFLENQLSTISMDTGHAPIWAGFDSVAMRADEAGYFGPHFIYKIGNRSSTTPPPPLESCAPVCRTIATFIDRTPREILVPQGYTEPVLRGVHNIVSQAGALARGDVRDAWMGRVNQLGAAIDRKFGPPPAIVIEPGDIAPPPVPIVVEL